MVGSVSSSTTPTTTTTSSATPPSSTTAASATGGQDIINLLGAGGGINIQSLATNLTTATIAPQQNILNTRKNTADTTISAVGTILSQVATLSSTITAIGDPNTFAVAPTTSDNTSVNVSFAKGAAPAPFHSSVTVTSLATAARVLFPPVSNPSTSLLGSDTGRTLTFTSGTPGTPGASLVSIDLSQNNTLNQVANAINQVSGLTAQIIQGGTASSPQYYLSVQASSGASNSFFPSVKVTATGQPADPTRGGLTAGTGTVVTEGTDANITVDGVTASSATNNFSNILPGITISAVKPTGQTAVTIGSTIDTTALTNSMQSLLQSYNSLLTSIQTQAHLDTTTSKNGPLAHNPAARDIVNQLSGLTTEPIIGYDAKVHTLSELGVSTNQDGSLSIDSATFASVLQSNPGAVEAVLGSKRSVADSQLSVQATSRATVPGVYTIAKVGDSSWTINGQPASYNGGVLKGAMGSAVDGLVVNLPYSLNTSAAVGYTTQLNYSKGMLERFSSLLAAATADKSPLQTVQTDANNDLTKIAADQTTLTNQQTAIQKQYITQFTAMQTLFNANSSTASSLTQMMTSWSSALKD
jgi:flagellar hook-associated protein 2